MKLAGDCGADTCRNEDALAAALLLEDAALQALPCCEVLPEDVPCCEREKSTLHFQHVLSVTEPGKRITVLHPHTNLGTAPFDVVDGVAGVEDD